MTERLRDADYVAKRLGVPRSWVYRAVRDGRRSYGTGTLYRRTDAHGSRVVGVVVRALA